VYLMSLYRTYRDLLAADFAKNGKVDARFTLAVWRLGQVLHEQPGLVPFALRRVSQLLDTLWLRGYLGALMPQHVRVGPGIRIPHCARGVVLHHTVRMGSDVTLYHQVTIGIRDDGPPVAATIGDGVYIGAGAKIIGPVTLGDGSRIGANAVVIRDVPAGATAVGVPAKITDVKREPRAEPA
jgi:serine O-acetyltransferase